MIQFRPYQQEMVSSLRLALPAHRSVVMVLGTGGGKTYTAAGVINLFLKKQRGGLAIMHRTELIQQWAKSMADLGVYAGAIKAGIPPTPGALAQVASVQTLSSRGGPDPSKVKWIFVDECHRIKAASYLKILEQYPKAYLIGLTATPVRSDGQALGDVFNHMILGPSKRNLIKQGFLVPSDPKINPLDPDLLKRINLNMKGDYRKGELGLLMSNSEVMSGLWSSWKKYAYGKKTLCFASSIEHSKDYVVAMFRDKGISAAHIDGKTPKRHRAQILKDHKEGRLIYLSNVGVLTEGYDDPSIMCVQLARPTKSYGLYNQMVGRGGRPYSGKDRYILLDHGNNVIEHSIPEDEPEWSLKKGAIKHQKEEEKAYRIKVKRNGQEQMFFVTASQIPQMKEEIELVEIDTTFRDGLIDDCFDYARRKTHRLSSAYYNYLQGLQRQNSKPSLPELHYFRKKLGYKPGWVKAQCRQIGIKTL